MSVATTTTATTDIGSLLEKMSSNDKDLRFIAVSDLINDLQQKTFELDDNSQHRIVQCVLQLLNDTNSEAQNQAVQCLGSLLYKVNGKAFKTISDTLCLNFTNKSDDARKLDDIITTGLKTIFASYLQKETQEYVFNEANVLMVHLVEALKHSPTISHNNRSKYRLEKAEHGELKILDIIIDTLSKPGANVKFYLFHTSIKGLLKKNLSSKRTDIIKRISILVKYLFI